MWSFSAVIWNVIFGYFMWNGLVHSLWDGYCCNNIWRWVRIRRGRAGPLGWWLAALHFTLEFAVRFPDSAIWDKTVSSPFIRKTQYRGEPPWPWGSVLGLRPLGLNFESCVWRAVSSHSSRYPQEVLLAQFSLYVHTSGLKPDSFHFYQKRKCDYSVVRDKLIYPNNIRIT